MTMTHKEALEKALDTWDEARTNELGVEAAIRAYIEARGLVLVPKTLPEDGALCGAVCDYTPWPVALWEDIVAAAPDPFKDDAP